MRIPLLRFLTLISVLSHSFFFVSSSVILIILLADLGDLLSPQKNNQPLFNE